MDCLCFCTDTVRFDTFNKLAADIDVSFGSPEARVIILPVLLFLMKLMNQNKKLFLKSNTQAGVHMRKHVELSFFTDLNVSATLLGPESA